MRTVRLLPIVIFAAFALLVLKGIGLVTDGGYVLVGSGAAQAQTQTDADNTRENAGQEAREERAADRATENLFSRAEPAPISSGQIDAVPITENSYGDKVAIGTTDGQDATEKAVLERLGERRTSLEIREQELEVRSALVEAAEKRLAERIARLEAVENRINALVDEKKELDNAQFAAVVGMYETMKPNNAAAIFDGLTMDVLLRVARAMNPRKMAPVLAKMDTGRAEELTLRLARIEPEPSLDAPIDELDNLPQIVGQ